MFIKLLITCGLIGIATLARGEDIVTPELDGIWKLSATRCLTGQPLPDFEIHPGETLSFIFNTHSRTAQMQSFERGCELESTGDLVIEGRNVKVINTRVNKSTCETMADTSETGHFARHTLDSGESVLVITVGAGSSCTDDGIGELTFSKAPLG